MALTKEDKAALMLLNMAPEVAESILAHLGPEHESAVRARMTAQKRSKGVGEELTGALHEIEELVNESRQEELRRIAALEAAAEQDSRQRKIKPIMQGDLDTGNDPVAALDQVGMDRLALAFQGESPRAVSMLLGCLNTDRAGAVLKLMQPQMRRDVMMHMGLGATDDSILVPLIARAVLQKSKVLDATPIALQSDDARFVKTAEILRLLEEQDRTQILKNIAQNDKKVADAIREYLYYFDDIIFIEDRSLQKILAGIDPRSLATSLKGANQRIVDKVMANVSARVREALGEEIEMLGPVTATQIDKARTEIVDIIQRLDQAGELVTTGKRGNVVA